MSYTEKIDVLDLLIAILMDYENRMDELVARLENLVEHFEVEDSVPKEVARALKEGISVRLLLDEMYTGLKQHFEILGYEVETIQNTDLKGAETRRVVEHTKFNDLLLVTSDQKTAELAEIIGVKYVLVPTNVMVARWVDSELRAHGVS